MRRTCYDSTVEGDAANDIPMHGDVKVGMIRYQERAVVAKQRRGRKRRSRRRGRKRRRRRRRHGICIVVGVSGDVYTNNSLNKSRSKETNPYFTYIRRHEDWKKSRQP